MGIDSPSRVGVAAWILVPMLGGLLSATACMVSVTPSEPVGTIVLIFVDFSGSIRGESRALFEQDIRGRIVSSLSAGDQILIAPIDDRTLTNFHPLVSATFPEMPEFNGWSDNTLQYNRQVKEIDAQVVELQKSVQDDVSDVFRRGYSSQQSDIFSALLIAEKLFHNEPRRKVLVLMSDMIVDYPPYRFDRIEWGTATNQKLLSELAERSLIPDLSDVCVYVSGASAMSAELAAKIGHFWQAYFECTDANMDPSRYAHVLLHWPPSEVCDLDQQQSGIGEIADRAAKR